MARCRCSDAMARTSSLEIFKAVDTNNDGFMTYGELQASIAGLGGAAFLQHRGADSGDSTNDASEDVVGHIIADMDVDKDGRISYTEFLAAALDRRLYEQERVCYEAFRLFDRDGNKSICRKELMHVLYDTEVETLMGTVAINRVMAQCDLNGDDKIDFSEFMRMMRS
eukprot:TRINITY_DN27228_c0_g1_i2.p2 TRINITY_DN27228_c0_g1~~TRINITY_DN27228_c0_g1_i2.p2  ORF type:complete len:175 (+),score=33.29 TRINITY_DN27228_c0_g1_i2:23-526(+)